MSFRGIQPFKPYRPSGTVYEAVTSVTANAAIPDGASQVRLSTNVGDSVVYVEFGKDNTVTAAAPTGGVGGIPIQPGSVEIFSVPFVSLSSGSPYIAFVTSAGAATLAIVPGDGN